MLEAMTPLTTECKCILRILHCPTMTGGNPQCLAWAERSLGLDSWSVAFTRNYLSYPCDEVLWEEATPLWQQQLRSWRLFFRAAHEYDVVHYNAGSPILPWDFPSRLAKGDSLKHLVLSAYTAVCRSAERSLLRRKVVAVTFQGDDARQGDFSLEHFPISIAREVGSDYYSPLTDARRRKRIRWFDEYADLIYALNPDLLWVLPKRASFLPYANVDITDWRPADKETSSTPLVLHAPSHRGAKGTRFIMDAVEHLRSEGIPFEFVLVENMSNAEARKLYERADLMVDQLLAGWYGGFAVEAMALGKPVICYLREPDLAFLPQQMRQDLPLINAEPGNILRVLRAWLTTRRGELAERGKRSRAYVERWHDPVKIAARLQEDYWCAGAAKKLSWAMPMIRD